MAAYLLIFDPLQRGALAISRRLHMQVVQLLNLCLFHNLKILGTRITINKAQFANPQLPTIIVANHQSMFDISLLYAVFPEKLPHFVAKKELAYWLPSISYNLRSGENAIIDRKDARQSIKTIATFAKLVLKNNYCAVIFPEGTRARTGCLKPFHTAGLAALLKYIPHAEIIPVAINGSWKLNRFGPSPAQTFSQIIINVGDKISKDEKSNIEEINNICRQFIAHSLLQ